MDIKYKITHKFLVVFVSGWMFVSNGNAATGDKLIITANIVNLRAAPTVEASVLIKLLKDRKVTEVHRQGGWVEINTGREDVRSGWIHQSLITKETSEESHEQQRFKKFIKKFNDYNEELNKETGKQYFKNTIHKENYNINVIATEDWLKIDQEERSLVLNNIFKLWSDVVPVGNSVSVIILDEQGEQHMIMLR